MVFISSQRVRGDQNRSGCIYSYRTAFKIETVEPCVLLIHPTTNWWRMRGAQIFYSIRLQIKPIGNGANCENPSQSLPHNAAPTTWTYDRALIPLVGPCPLPIHPMINWWKMRGHKSFIAFNCRPSPLVLEWIVKILHNLFPSCLSPIIITIGLKNKLLSQ